MKTNLSNQTVLITGASGNVGWGIAHAAHEAGANIVLPVRGEASRATVADEFRDQRALIASVDFANMSALEHLRDQAVAQFGAIDHVIAPLGSWWRKGASLDQPPDELRDLLDAYVEAQFRLLKAMAPSLRASCGSYTLITGAAGEARDIPGSSLLVVAVAAQFALSRVLRHELAHEPFRVNELRFNTRIERQPRPGVIPARQIGEVVIEAVIGEARGALYRDEGGGRLAIVSEG